MKLVDWWHRKSDRAWVKCPVLVQAILIPWLLIGIVVAMAPELQKMPGSVRLIVGLPAALGMLWMAFGMLLIIVDKIVSGASFVRRKLTGVG